jgi:host factor-I protein
MATKKDTPAASKSALKEPKDLQSLFLTHLAKGHAPVTVFLTNGVKLSGNLSYVDEQAVALARDGVTQLVFKHAIATVMPQDAFSIYDLVEDE